MENLYFLVETKLHHMDGSTALMREVRPVSTEFPPTHYSVISEVIMAVANLYVSVNPNDSYDPTLGEWGAWVDKKGKVKYEVCNVEDVTGRMDDELDSICRVEEIVVPAHAVESAHKYNLVSIRYYE